MALTIYVLKSQKYNISQHNFSRKDLSESNIIICQNNVQNLTHPDGFPQFNVTPIKQRALGLVDK